MRQRVLLTTLALLLVGLSPSALADDDRTALHVTPLEAKFGLVVQGLNNHVEKTRALASYMKRVGLIAPKFERIVDKIAEETNAANGKTLWPESMGLPANGAMAVYGVIHDGKPDEIFVMDVEYKKDFIRFMRRTAEDMQYVEEGKKPKRAKVTRSSVKGADQFEVTLQGRAQGQPILTVRFKDGVAALAISEEVAKADRRAQRKKGSALDHVAWSGAPMPPVFKKLDADPGRLSVAFWARPEAMGEHGPREFAIVESISGLFVIDGSGSHVDANLSFSKQAAPFMKIGRPGPEGANARESMMHVAAEAPTWARFSFSRAEALELIKTMAGKSFDTEVARAKKELGFHPIKDFAQLFTGDFLISCHDGIADCVIAIGAGKPSKTERAMKGLLGSLSKLSKKVHFEHDRRAVIGAPKGSVFLTTSVFEQATTERGRIDAKAERLDLAKVYWGVRPDLLLIGLTPHGVKRAMKRMTTEKTTWTSPIAGEHTPPIGFDDKTSIAAHQELSELSSMVRQLLAIGRHTLPAKEWTGIAVRSVDAVMALYDRTLSSNSVVRGEGLDWQLTGRVMTLPSEGDKGYDAALDKAYRAALKLRYQGQIRASNEELIALSERSPMSPWGKKARSMALSGGSLGFATLPLIGGLAAMLGEAFDSYRHKSMHIEAMPPSGFHP